MRSGALTLALLATPVLAGAPLLAGCNDLFGVGTVEQLTGTGGSTTTSTTSTTDSPSTSTGPSTGAGGSTTSTGTAGGGSASTGTAGSMSTGSTTTTTGCEEVAIANNLLQDPSFETSGSWATTFGGDLEATIKLESVPAESCDVACGDLVGHLIGDIVPEMAPDGGAGGVSFTVSQSVSPKIELGGVFRLSAKYSFSGTDQFYLGLFSSSHYIGTPFIHGNQVGNHYVLDDFAIPVADPRRAGNSARLEIHADTVLPDVEAFIDCAGLTYDPPPGPEILPNGWFTLGSTGWTAINGASSQTSAVNGQCDAGVVEVTVPVGSSGAILQTDVIAGSWPAGTKFRVGGAIGALSFADEPVFDLRLRLLYADDSDPQTDDYVTVITNGINNSELWGYAIGTVTAERPVIGLFTTVSVPAVVAETVYRADCFTVRVTN